MFFLSAAKCLSHNITYCIRTYFKNDFTFASFIYDVATFILADIQLCVSKYPKRTITKTFKQKAFLSFMKDENTIKPNSPDILQILISIINDKLEATNSKLNDFEEALNNVIDAIAEQQCE